MALVEPVAREVLDESEQLVAELLVVPLADAACDELLLLLGHERGDLLAHRLPEAVGIGHREPRDGLGGLHDLLLVHHDPVGVREDGLEVIVQVADAGLAVLAIGVLGVHAGPQRSGSVQGIEGDEVFEPVGSEVAHEGAHRAALELEDTDRVAATQHLVDRLVVERHGVDVRPVPRVAFDQVQGTLDRREVAQAEEVHLQEAERLDAVHLVLGDDLGIVTLLLGGHDVREGVR